MVLNIMHIYGTSTANRQITSINRAAGVYPRRISIQNMQIIIQNNMRFYIATPYMNSKGICVYPKKWMSNIIF